jgi:hypothetical protein
VFGKQNKGIFLFFYFYFFFGEKFRRKLAGKWRQVAENGGFWLPVADGGGC